MDYRQFITTVMAQDERNIFSISLGSWEGLPKAIQPFFNEFSPDDVEVILNDMTSIKLFPLSELYSLQEEYKPAKGLYVFATHEGDPIACRGEEIVTWSHGSHYISIEKLADSIDAWISMVVLNMKK